MIVYNILKNPKLFSKFDWFDNGIATLKNETFSVIDGRYRKGQQKKTLEIELQSNLRLLEYLMTMEFDVNTANIESLDDVKRFKDYQKLRTDVEKRILKITDNQEKSVK